MGKLPFGPIEERHAVSVVIAMCGRLIAVEYPMNYLRPLITKWSHGLLGKTFPRRVTAPNGSPRWQAATGRSFATLEEARKA
jgi:hypothetical protein